MCNSLQFTDKERSFVRGQRIPQKYLEVTPGAEQPNGYLWDGHARSDGSISRPHRSLKKQWLDKGFEPATIKNIESFTEHNKKLTITKINLRNRSQIGALINRRTGILVILTRPAKTKTEKAIHHRFPVYINNQDKLTKIIKTYNDKTLHN